MDKMYIKIPNEPLLNMIAKKAARNSIKVLCITSILNELFKHTNIHEPEPTEKLCPQHVKFLTIWLTDKELKDIKEVLYPRQWEYFIALRS